MRAPPPAPLDSRNRLLHLSPTPHRTASRPPAAPLAQQLANLGFRRIGDVGPAEPRFQFGVARTVSGHRIFLGTDPSGRAVGLQLSFEKIE